MRKSLEDSNEPVRAAAAEALGTLMKVVGERAMGGKVEELDELRRVKVKEAFEKAVTKCRNGASGAGVPAPKAAAAAPAPQPSAKPKPVSGSSFAEGQTADEIATATARRQQGERAAAPNCCLTTPWLSTSFAKSSPTSGSQRSACATDGECAVLKPAPRLTLRRQAKKPPAAAAPPAPPAVKKPPPTAAASSKAPTGPAKPSEPLKYKFSQEDAEAQVDAGALPAAVVAQLNDANWKERLAGITALYEWLEGGEIGNVESELVVRWLSKKPGWKESNFQVSRVQQPRCCECS